MDTNVVFRRFVAVVLDGILLFAVSAVILTLLELVGINTWEVDSSDFSWSATTTFGGTLISALLSLVYKVWMEANRNGQTLGKQALGIRVVKEGSGATITTEDALVRGLFWVVPFSLSGFGSALLGFIGFVWLVAGLVSLIASPTRQRLGDRFAGTVVVRDDPTLAAHMVFGQPARLSGQPMPESPIQHPATSVAGETWIKCSYCDSRFPSSRAHKGIWQGQSVRLCPNCGAPLNEESLSS